MEHPALTAHGDPSPNQGPRSEAVVDLNAAILDQVGNLVIVLDRRGRIVRFNQACEELTGYAQADLRNRTLWDFLVPPEELAGVKEVFGNPRAELYPNQHENHWVCRDGSRRLIAWRNTALTDPAGGLAYVIGTGADITEIRLAERRAHLHEQRFRALIEHSRGITLLLDREGIISYIGSFTEALFGRPRDVMLGTQAAQYVHPDDLPLRLGRGEAVIPRLIRIHRADGSWRTCEAASDYRVDDPAIGGIIVSLHDVTDLVQATEELRRRVEEADVMAMVSAALNRALEPTQVYDLLLMQVARVLPCDHAEVVVYEDDWAVVAANWGTPYLAPGTRLFPLEGDWQPWIPENHEGPVYLEEADTTPGWRHVAPFTGIHTMHSVIALPLIIDGRVLGSFAVRSHRPRFYDERHLKLAATLGQIIIQALRNARLFAAEKHRAREAEEMARVQSDFVAAVSHELRTPLTAIIGYAELMQARWYTTSDEHRLDRLRRITASAQRQCRLVEDLLLLTSLEVDHLAPVSESTCLQAIVERAVNEVRSIYWGQHIEVSGDPAVMVHADADRTMQVVANLLDNAAKYSREGSSISIEWQRENTEVAIRVRDQGTGIPEDGRDRLFTRFGRIPGSTGRSGRVGTGLGLYLSRQLATAMSGSLTLEYSSPTGSVFCARFPGA